MKKLEVGVKRMTRDEKIQKIKDKICNEIESYKKFYLADGGGFKKVALGDEKLFTLSLATLYYMESYVNLEISFKERYPNGRYILTDETLDILLNMTHIVSSIFTILDMENKSDDTVDNIYFHVADFMCDEFFENTVVSIFDRILYHDSNKEVKE